MVGEIRDEETALIAFRAAMTGHLVLSTLHTNDAVATLRGCSTWAWPLTWCPLPCWGFSPSGWCEIAPTAGKPMGRNRPSFYNGTPIGPRSWVPWANF